MSNKILDHIEHVIFEGERRPAPQGVSFSLRTEADAERSNPLSFQYKVRGELRVFYEQFVSEGASSEERRIIWERAKSAIARHIYSDTLDDLMELREAIWSEGIQSGPAVDKINRMIDELLGTMTRFE